jgi:hypothetical protein
VHDSDILRRNRRELTPEFFHFCAVNARRGIDESARIDEMRRPARMDVNGRAEFRETPGGPSMIEMNVTEKDVANVVGGETRFLEFSSQVREGRLRSSVEKHKPLASLEGRRRNDTSPAELLCVENMNAHCS